MLEQSLLFRASQISLVRTHKQEVCLSFLARTIASGECRESISQVTTPTLITGRFLEMGVFAPALARGLHSMCLADWAGSGGCRGAINWQSFLINPSM